MVQFRITAMIIASKRLADKRAADLLEQKTYIRDNREEKAILHASIVQTAGRYYNRRHLPEKTIPDKKRGDGIYDRYDRAGIR